MKYGLINRLKRLNWVSLVQGFWVFLALIISIGQTRAQGMNDPTKPPEAVMELMPEPEDGEVQEWKLQGLKAEGKQGIAIVNGQWIAVGKEYAGYRLAKVTETQALFVNKTGNKKVLSLGVKEYQTTPKSNNRAKSHTKNSAAKKTQMHK